MKYAPEQLMQKKEIPGISNASRAVIDLAGPVRLREGPRLHHRAPVQATEDIVGIRGPLDEGNLVYTGVQLFDLSSKAARQQTSKGG
jgi:hypothetical protein